MEFSNSKRLLKWWTHFSITSGVLSCVRPTSFTFIELPYSAPLHMREIGVLPILK
jgi:hypothetical protein